MLIILGIYRFQGTYLLHTAYIVYRPSPCWWQFVFWSLCVAFQWYSVMGITPESSAAQSEEFSIQISHGIHFCGLGLIKLRTNSELIQNIFVILV